MNNPFEGKAVKFDTSEQLDHLAELARGYGYRVGTCIFNLDRPYFRYSTNTEESDVYHNTNGLPEIHYSDFVASLDGVKVKSLNETLLSDLVNVNHSEQQPDMVNHPPHYTVNGIEVIDVIEAYGLCYLLGNVIKYVLRANRKGNKKQDLQKAAWYLNRAICKLD